MPAYSWHLATACDRSSDTDDLHGDAGATAPTLPTHGPFLLIRGITSPKMHELTSNDLILVLGESGELAASATKPDYLSGLGPMNHPPTMSAKFAAEPFILAFISYGFFGPIRQYWATPFVVTTSYRSFFQTDNIHW